MQVFRRPARLEGYDYSRSGLYCVRTFVKDRQCLLGEVVSGHMIPNFAGEIVSRQWKWLEEQYAYILLHGYCLLPDQCIGILEIAMEEAPRGAKIKPVAGLMGAWKTTSSKEIRLGGMAAFAWEASFLVDIVQSLGQYQGLCNEFEVAPANWRPAKRLL